MKQTSSDKIDGIKELIIAFLGIILTSYLK